MYIAICRFIGIKTEDEEKLKELIDSLTQKAKNIVLAKNTE